MIYFVHFGGNGGLYLTLKYKTRRAAMRAIRSAEREHGIARLQVYEDDKP